VGCRWKEERAWCERDPQRRQLVADSCVCRDPLPNARSDECPECAFGSIDLQKNGDGRWKVEWEPVQCPVGSSNFAYGYQGGNDYYKKVQVATARVPISKLEIKRNGAWQQAVATVSSHTGPAPPLPMQAPCAF
jgi:hypothetical protein